MNLIKLGQIIGNRKVSSYKLFKDLRYDIEKISSGFVVLSLDYAYSLTKKRPAKIFCISEKN